MIDNMKDEPHLIDDKEMSLEEYKKKWIAEDSSPIGMKQDGTIKMYAPGEPIRRHILTVRRADGSFF
jgi:hypothetical protein